MKAEMPETMETRFDHVACKLPRCGEQRVLLVRVGGGGDAGLGGGGRVRVRLRVRLRLRLRLRHPAQRLLRGDVGVGGDALVLQQRVGGGGGHGAVAGSDGAGVACDGEGAAAALVAPAGDGPGALDPVAGRRHQRVRVLVAELLCPCGGGGRTGGGGNKY